MKPTHQVLIEKIMDYFKIQQGVGQYHDYITKTMIEHIYNEFLEELEDQPTSTADAIFEQAASIETEVTGTVDKIVDDTQTFAFEPQKAAELGYEAVKKLLTAVQDHAIQENRKMIRDLKNHVTILSADVALMNKRLLNLEDQDVKGIKDVITRNLTISIMNHKRATEGISHEESKKLASIAKTAFDIVQKWENND
jgi:DNA-binding ferritin-like protein